jgi:plastocyanin
MRVMATDGRLYEATCVSSRRTSARVASSALAALISLPVIVEPSVLAAQARVATGRLEGLVRLTTGTGTPSTATAYSRRTVAPRVKVLPEARNVVVSLMDVPAAGRLAPTHVEVTQDDEQFVPHVVAITVGSRVEFPNRDPYFHNVFSLSRPATFDLGRYAPGDSRTSVFDKPGIVKVYCHIHSQMSALIRVFDHPWFTIPNEAGEFTIEDVPAGQHSLVAWHERIGERRERVTIRPGSTTEVIFTLPVLETAP